MSISYYLLVFFLCLSLHACHARRLGDIDKKLHIFNKNNEKKGLDSIPALPKAKPSSPNELETEKGGKTEEPRLADKNQKLKVAKDAKQTISNDETGKTSGAAQTESLSSVSWRVPHSKRSEKHPGFNSDYSPPKTHPPSHN